MALRDRKMTLSLSVNGKFFIASVIGGIFYEDRNVSNLFTKNEGNIRSGSED
jgi:hypothetical protein